MAKKGNVLGSWAFLIGVVLAVVLGFGVGGDLTGTMTWILVVIGLVVGLFNVAGEETTPFLMSGTVLVIVSSLGGDALSSIKVVGGILQALLVLFVPATIIVAVKNVFGLARK